jgi:hypothetical protein
MSELAGGSPEADDTPGATADVDDGTRQAPDREQSSGGVRPRQTEAAAERAEPLTRAEYADLMHHRLPVGDEGDTSANERAADTSHNAVTSHDLTRGLAEPRTREEVAEAARSGPDPLTSAAGTGADQITHYAAEFKGRRIDLFTDGRQWVTADEPDAGYEAAAVSGHAPGSGQSGDRLDAHVPAVETVDFEGHPLEITGNANDGIWIEGLPGEPPRQVGDLLVSPEDDKHSRADRLFGRAVDSAEDLFDSVEKNASLGFEVFQRPPVHAEVPVPVSHYTPEAQPAPDAGNLATAALALGYLSWAAGRWIHGRMRDSSP